MRLAFGQASGNPVAGRSQPLGDADQRHADQRGRVVAGKRFQQCDAQAFRTHGAGAVERLVAVDVALDFRLVKVAVGEPRRDDVDLQLLEGALVEAVEEVGLVVVAAPPQSAGSDEAFYSFCILS